MRIIFDNYTCPSCGSNTFEARHEPTEWSHRRGFTNPNGYADFFYGHCLCGYNLNLSMAILEEYGRRGDDGRWSGPYPCLALERGYVETVPDPKNSTKTIDIIVYDYECSRSKRRKATKEP